MNTNSNGPKNLPWTLFFLRLSVFGVFFVWTLDKFVRPSHAAIVYQKFYLSPAFGTTVFFVLGALEMILIFAFLAGIKKRFTYGFVFLLHFVSTISCYAQYVAPFQQMNIMFYAAWPMLAACFALYVLRDYDTILSVPSK